MSVHKTKGMGRGPLPPGAAVTWKVLVVAK